jgi:1-deoxy-D-xylulose-5-phosphate reductoisomerase
MVEFEDGTLKAQLGPTNMGQPIQHALFFPERVANPSLPTIDAVAMGSLTFEEMDPSLYPCFSLAIEYGQKGGTYPAVLAGADEAAVQLFLDGQIKFTDIPNAVRKTLEMHSVVAEPSIDDTIAAANWATEITLSSNKSSIILG